MGRRHIPVREKLFKHVGDPQLLRHHGGEAFGGFSEEVGEALVALNHYRRGRLDDKSKVIEELGDVIVVCEWLATLIDGDTEQLHGFVVQKLVRMAERNGFPIPDPTEL